MRFVCATHLEEVMYNFYNVKRLLSWRSVQPHLCTAAVALSLGCTWRAPRAAFRHGGLTTAVAATVASVLTALPAALLQLAVGQLSQQDAVGIWRAVPFFKGVGFIRLLISFIAALYTAVYVAISIVHIFYSLSNAAALPECITVLDTSEGDVEMVYNGTSCISETFLGPVAERPEYYIALACVVVALWLLFPFILYNPVKLMKRVFYALGSLVLLLGIITVSFVGNKGDVPSMVNGSDWAHLAQPNIWFGAAVHALLSNQIAGGYLISSGDSIYANTNVQWTALTFVGSNILAVWVGILYWYAVGGAGDKETNNLAVIVQIYKVSAENDLDSVWPILMFSMLTLSGIITMLTLLYPLYDRFRRVGGHKWRHLSIASSVVGAAGAFAVFFVGHTALMLVEDVVLPCLVTVTTVLEMWAFVFIYGWKNLVEDIEFLLGSKLLRFWLWGMASVPGIVVSLTLWWATVCIRNNPEWLQAPWESTGIVASISAAFVLFIVFAILSVAKQVQYDLVGKLKSSFRPSRHWGPRDPITHHYWLARREEGDASEPRTRFRRHELGQLSGIGGRGHTLHPQTITRPHKNNVNKIRSHSDDLLVVQRRRSLVAGQNPNNMETRKRSKSLDWEAVRVMQIKHKLNNLRVSLTSGASASSYHVKNNNNCAKSGLE